MNSFLDCIQALCTFLDSFQQRIVDQGLCSLHTFLDKLKDMAQSKRAFLYSSCYPNRHTHCNRLHSEPKYYNLTLSIGIHFENVLRERRGKSHIHTKAVKAKIFKIFIVESPSLLKLDD